MRLQRKLQFEERKQANQRRVILFLSLFFFSPIFQLWLFALKVVLVYSLTGLMINVIMENLNF